MTTTSLLQQLLDVVNHRLLPAIQAHRELDTNHPATHVWDQDSDERTCLAITFRLVQRALTKSRYPSTQPVAPLDAFIDTFLNDELLTISERLERLPANAKHLGSIPTLLVEAVLPPTKRSSLGAFYTPEPVAVRVLRHVRWTPQDRRSLLDPTCGTGAFLASALAVRLSSRTSWSYGQLQQVLDRIVGVDIDPLAVLAAETTLLLNVWPFVAPGAPWPHPRVVQGDVLAERFVTPPADVLVGNPPWLRWSSLPPDQRDACQRWVQRLGLLTNDSYHGGSELDLAAAIACINITRDLNHDGTASLLLPNTLLNTPSATQFRRWTSPDGTPLRVTAIDTFEGRRVFPGVSFQPIIVTWRKTKPAPAQIVGQRIRLSRSSLTNVSAVAEEGVITEVGAEHRWVWSSRHEVPIFEHLSGETTWIRGRKGVTTDLNGAYFVHVLGPGTRGRTVRVVNDVPTRGYTVPVHEFDVESEIVFPLLKGARQVRAFEVQQSDVAVLIPNRDVSSRVSEDEFANSFPLAFQHFRWVEQQTGGALSRRSTYRRMLQKRKAPFFFVYNVGPYTFSPIKVVWAEVSSELRATVVESAPTKRKRRSLGVVVPDHKIYFAPLSDLSSADYLCAWLNSAPVRLFASRVFRKLQVGTLFRQLSIPPFDMTNPSHQALRTAGTQCRVHGPNKQRLREIDALVHRLVST